MHSRGLTKNTHHANEEPGLLCRATDTSITDDTNGKTGSKTSETDRETGTELDEALEERHLHCDCHTGA